MAKKTTRKQRHERVQANFSMNLSVNAAVGILLAIIGTFVLFFGGVKGAVEMLMVVIGVVLVCFGAVAIVNYFRHNNSSKSLLVGILEAVVGVAIIIAGNFIALWMFLIIGILIALVGVYVLVKSRGDLIEILIGIAYIVLGVLILLYAFGWQWVMDWGKFIIGIASYLGAVFFLFF